MSPDKSEAMWFCRRADHGTPPAGYRLRFVGAEIGVGTSMKYLRLTFDNHSAFRAHFELPGTIGRGDGECITTFAASAGRTRRESAPAARQRSARLLYGAPIWAEDLMTSHCSLLKVRRLHRTVAIRVVRGFRTISAAAAAMFAGFPPLELQALRCREIYLHTRGLSDGVEPVGNDVEGRRRRAPLDR